MFIEIEQMFIILFHHCGEKETIASIFYQNFDYYIELMLEEWIVFRNDKNVDKHFSFKKWEM